MRLALVTSDFPPRTGGIETLFAALARELATTDSVTVLAPDVRGAQEHDRALPFEVVRIPGPEDAFPLALAPALAVLGPLDGTLHAQWASLPAALTLRRAGRVRRVVTYAHGRELLLRPFAALAPAKRAYDTARRRALVAADHVVAVSRYTASLAATLGVPETHVTVIPPGVLAPPPAAAAGAALRTRSGVGARPVLLSLARLVPRKGVDTVLEALPAVLREVPDAVYVVAGDGTERASLEALASSLGVAASVRFLGHVDEDARAAWLAAATVFVLPARSEPPDVEGFGIVFLEAAAARLPSVAARAGGVPDAVRDDETGLLVPPDDPAALASALVRLLGDAPLRARLGAAGRARVETEHAWPSIAERIRVLLFA